MLLDIRSYGWLFLLVALLMSGCDESAAPAAAQVEGGDSGAVSIEHAAGQTRLPQTPQRIVALEWTYAEYLLALGVQPVAVADVAGMRQWLELPVEISPDVVDVGTRQEPSLEHIMQVQPDLIISIALRHKAIYPTLSKIAPTLLFDPYDAPQGEFARMEETFRELARAVRREAQAEQVLGDLQRSIEAARERFSALPEEERRFVLVGFPPNTRVYRVFADNSLAVQLLEQAGLINAWPVEREPHGFTTVGLEQLTQLGPVHFFYVAQPYDARQVENPTGVWAELPFVKANRAHALGARVWLFGGPLSSQLLLSRVTENLDEAVPIAGVQP